MAEVGCPFCGRMMAVPDKLLGGRVQCTQCGQWCETEKPGARQKGPPIIIMYLVGQISTGLLVGLSLLCANSARDSAMESYREARAQGVYVRSEKDLDLGKARGWESMATGAYYGAIALGIFTTLVMAWFAFRMWSSLPASRRWIPPGAAAAGLFVPTLSLIWLAVVFVGWGLTFDRLRKSVRGYTPPGPKNAAIVLTVSVWLQWTPLLALLWGLVTEAEEFPGGFISWGVGLIGWVVTVFAFPMVVGEYRNALPVIRKVLAGPTGSPSST